MLIVIALALVGSYYAFVRDKTRHEFLTASAHADITNVYERREVDPTSGAQHIVNIQVTYKYMIERRAYQRSLQLGVGANNLYRPGQAAIVCYNPNHPEEAKLFPADHTCGKL